MGEYFFLCYTSKQRCIYMVFANGLFLTFYTINENRINITCFGYFGVFPPLSASCSFPSPHFGLQKSLWERGDFPSLFILLGSISSQFLSPIFGLESFAKRESALLSSLLLFVFLPIEKIEVMALSHHLTHCLRHFSLPFVFYFFCFLASHVFVLQMVRKVELVTQF